MGPLAISSIFFLILSSPFPSSLLFSVSSPWTRQHLLCSRDSPHLPIHRGLRGPEQCVPSSRWVDPAPCSRSIALPPGRERCHHVPRHLQRAVRQQRGAGPG